MAEEKKKSLLKNGIWIQEKQGVLTMGSLDSDDSTVVELSPEFSASVFEFEQDMMDALYGDKAIDFVPGKIGVKKLLARMVDSFDMTGIQVSISCPDSAVIHGDYDGLFDLFAGFLRNSLEHELLHMDSPAIHISVSVVADTLCLVYRDSGDGSGDSRLKKEMRYITETLNGKVSQKSSHGRGSYFDIVIPVKQV
jgi:hypothetical protein